MTATTLTRPTPLFVVPSTSLEPRQFIVTGTLVGRTPTDPWMTQAVKMPVTATHYLKAIEIAGDGARSNGFLLVDATATVVFGQQGPTADPTADMHEQGEEVGR